MTTDEKDKLKHDFLNSIVIINSLTKSASNFVEITSLGALDHCDAISPKQIELFKRSMEAIRQETAKIELSFNKILNEIY